MKESRFSKNLPKKRSLGSQSWGRSLLEGNTVVFKNSLVDSDGDRQRKGSRDQFLVLNDNASFAVEHFRVYKVKASEHFAASALEKLS